MLWMSWAARWRGLSCCWWRVINTNKEAPLMGCYHSETTIRQSPSLNCSESESCFFDVNPSNIQIQFIRIKFNMFARAGGLWNKTVFNLFALAVSYELRSRRLIHENKLSCIDISALAADNFAFAVKNCTISSLHTKQSHIKWLKNLK